MSLTSGYGAYYRDRPVLITGGLGFIGSNLAHRLVELGARVSIVDALIPGHGGNPFNISGLEGRVQVHIADLRDQQAMSDLVAGMDLIFNLAGQVSHIDSMTDPYTDLDVNCRSQLSLLEACRVRNPRVRIVFAGTRQIYGRPDVLPVSESHPVRPTDVNGINKAAAEQYHLVYHKAYGIEACSLRLTNVYGPRQLLQHNRQGFIGWFIRQAIEDQEIQIYGDGTQVRDLLYVDDAVDAFLRTGARTTTAGQVFNVGGAEPVSHRDLVTLLVAVAGSGRYRFVEWPPEKKAIDIGNFVADSSVIHRVVGWQPCTALRDGLTKTISYYREHLNEYVSPTPARAL